ncbi:MAG TPA: ATP-binding cassette domain-containing protein [bacterium]|nr:ATP-binding cassette domain-containing protein [bacterium]
MPEPAALQTPGLAFRYPLADAPALTLPPLAIGARERVLVAGPTGSGKSTLLNLLLGFLGRGSGGTLEGDAWLFGRPARDADPAWVGGHLGVVFQNPADQGVTGQVAEEVALGLRVLGLEEAEVQQRTTEALAEVGLADRAHDPPALLSGGQQQRLAIACALARRPQLLVLDEPFSQLDPRGAATLAALLDRLTRQHGIGVVIAEHRHELALRTVDRVIALERGRVVHDGSTLPAGLVPPLPHPMAVASGTAFVQLDRTVVRYPGAAQPALSIDASLPGGAPIALLGTNGSGKSTLLHLLAGLQKPFSGAVRWAAGTPRVALVPQNPDLRLLGRTVREDLAFTRAPAEDIVRMAADASLPPLDSPPLGASKGQRLQIALASALLERPGVLLLDEPTTGQDRTHVAAIIDQLRRFQGQVIFTTHDLDAAAALAGWVLILRQGGVLASSPAHQALTDRALLREAGLLPEAADG